MSIKTEQRLCVAGVLTFAGIFIDLAARGVDSLYGRFFIWLCTL